MSAGSVGVGRSILRSLRVQPIVMGVGGESEESVKSVVPGVFPGQQVVVTLSVVALPEFDR